MKFFRLHITSRAWSALGLVTCGHFTCTFGGSVVTGHPSDRSPGHNLVDGQAVKAWTGSWPVGRVALQCSGQDCPLV